MAYDNAGNRVKKTAKFPPGTHPLQFKVNERVIEAANAAGCQIYLVGGYLRDALANKTATLAKDIDYAVANTCAYQFAENLAKQLHAHFVPLDRVNDTARVVCEDGTILDFAGTMGGSLESDMFRRDFSINALYWDPKDPDLICDLVGGIDDITSGVVRGLSPENLLEDPLRLLRAFRFAANYDFVIEKQTLAWIEQYHSKIKDVARERVHYELFIILAVHSSAELLKQMAQVGLMEDIFPELTSTRNVPVNAFHHLGLFDHSVETLLQCENFLHKDFWSKENFDRSLSYGVTKLAATKLACLLHDIGKPATWQITPEGKHTFITHESLGSEMVTAIGEREKWSKPISRFITKLVRWHLRPGQLFHHGDPTTKAVQRFYRNIKDEVPDLILLALADLAATRGPSMTEANSAKLQSQLIELLQGYYVYNQESQTVPQLIDGYQVMKLLGIEPGPIVGEILLALEDAQMDRSINNRQEAETFVRKFYEDRHSRS